MFLLGIDIGSSSVKAALVDASSGASIGTAFSPQTEMEIMAPHPGWAEQNPETWWLHCCIAVQQLLQQTGIAPSSVAGIGIAYQMHGLVTLDTNGQPVRPAIIWCDSRAVDIGDRAFSALGTSFCLEHYLNSPGNFTASKLRWVQENEPDHYARIAHIMLPGDYIAYRMTGTICTTISGLSEGVLWDFKQHTLALDLLAHYQIDTDLIPPVAPTFGIQGRLHSAAAEALGLPTGVPVAYRAGDQPNNALSLHALSPGEVAATGGTSGVVYAVMDQLVSDQQQRINSFAHVNHAKNDPHIGVLLCINGAGSMYRWVRQQIMGQQTAYSTLEAMAASAPVGSDGLLALPFGNGAERMLGNKNIGAHLIGLDLNRHTQAHILRGTLEGIAFAFVYGMKMLQEMGLNLDIIRVGNDNLFQSVVFSNTISNMLGCRIEMLQTNGAIGAAIAAGAGIGHWPNLTDGFAGLQKVNTYEPATENTKVKAAYLHWESALCTINSNKVI